MTKRLFKACAVVEITGGMKSVLMAAAHQDKCDRIKTTAVEFAHLERARAQYVEAGLAFFRLAELCARRQLTLAKKGK